MSRGPNRATLAQIADVLGDDALFATTDDGWRMLRVSRAKLAAELGITPGNLGHKLRRLRDHDLVLGNRFDAERISALAGGRIPLSAAAEPSPPVGKPACDDDLVGAIEDVVAAGELLAARGHDDLATLSARVAQILIGVAARRRDVYVETSRETSRQNVAKRDAYENHDDDDDENHSISSHSDTKTRDAYAETSRDSSRLVASPLSVADLREIVAPLGRVDLNDKLVAAARSWPRSDLESVVACIAGDADVTNPAGALFRTVVSGWTRYTDQPATQTSVPARCDTQAMPPDPVAEQVERIRAEMDAPPEEPLAIADALALMRARLRPEREEAS